MTGSQSAETRKAGPNWPEGRQPAEEQHDDDGAEQDQDERAGEAGGAGEDGVADLHGDAAAAALGRRLADGDGLLQVP